jgi:BirA family biotin operon repressor/biotin-[acetyl-CoA-carboxylase] ligase
MSNNLPSPADFSWHIEHHPSLDSTNTRAREEILRRWGGGQSPPLPVEGLVILADRQTRGRGQHDRPWVSPPGGLYCSAVVEQVPAQYRHLLALIAGVAIADLLEQANVKLRWPNDLMLQGKKLGGVLCESVAMGTRWAGIIGIGLNITTAASAFPPELQPIATSLAIEGLTLPPLDQLSARLLDALSVRLRQCSQDGITSIIQRARQLDSLNGHEVSAESETGRITGIAAGIDDEGGLMLQVGAGSVHLQVASLLKVDGRDLRAP